MKVSQKLAILIKNLYLSKQYGARWLLSELPDKGRKLGSHRQSAEENPKDGYVRLLRSGRLRSARSSGGPCAQSGGQAKKAPISS